MAWSQKFRLTPVIQPPTLLQNVLFLLTSVVQNVSVCTMDFLSGGKNTLLLLLYVTVCEKVVPRLNKHDDVIEWNFMKSPPTKWRAGCAPTVLSAMLANNFSTSTCFVIFELIKFMCFSSTLIFTDKEFLISRPPRTRSKFNPHPHVKQFGFPHPPRKCGNHTTRDRPIFGFYRYRTKRPILSASVGVDKRCYPDNLRSHIQITCARKHNDASQDSYLTARLAGRPVTKGGAGGRSPLEKCVEHNLKLLDIV